MNLGLFHNNVVLTITDVGDVTLAEIPGLDPAHIKKKINQESLGSGFVSSDISIVFNIYLREHKA